MQNQIIHNDPDISARDSDDQKVSMQQIWDFTPTGRYTEERMKALDECYGDFLLPQEHHLLHHFVILNN